MIKRHNFANSQSLAVTLADKVAEDLRNGINTRGTASLAVSGGSTPKLFFVTLAQRNDVDWSKVTITLVDERWVDPGSPRSNASLVTQNLLRGPAASARFVPLFSGGQHPDQEKIAQTNAALLGVNVPFDAVILGMGNDGHTASFFPAGDTLNAALTSKGPALAISAPGAEEPRVTLTLPFLLATSNLYLHIEGEEKNLTLEKALAGPTHDEGVNQMPVRAVLGQKQINVNIYWCK